MGASELCLFKALLEGRTGGQKETARSLGGKVCNALVLAVIKEAKPNKARQARYASHR